MSPPRSRRLTIRLARSERSKLEIAAALQNETVSATVRRLAVAAAQEEIRRIGKRPETEADEEIEADAMDTTVEAQDG